MRESDKRIPTIFYNPSEIPNPKPKKASKPLLKAVAARIQSQEGLYRELLSLCGCGKDTRGGQRQQPEYMALLVGTVAQALLDVEERRSVKREKDLSTGLALKTAATWRDRVIEADERSERLKDFSRIAHRRVIAQQKSQALASKPTLHDKDAFRRSTVQLYDYFSALTPQPYRFMAAILGLFNLHPRGFCQGCTHFPAQRRPLHRHKKRASRQ